MSSKNCGIQMPYCSKNVNCIILKIYNIVSSTRLISLVACILILSTSYPYAVAETDKEWKTNEKCRQTILKKYPDAICEVLKDPQHCKSLCEKHGTNACQESKGEIKKLLCKRKTKNSKEESVEIEEQGPKMCCCHVICHEEDKQQQSKTDHKHELLTKYKTLGINI